MRKIKSKSKVFLLRKIEDWKLNCCAKANQIIQQSTQGNPINTSTANPINLKAKVKGTQIPVSHQKRSQKRNQGNVQITFNNQLNNYTTPIKISNRKPRDLDPSSRSPQISRSTSGRSNCKSVHKWKAGKLIESGKCIISQKACINDSIRLWNKLQIKVTSSKTLNQIKTQTEIFVQAKPV